MEITNTQVTDDNINICIEEVKNTLVNQPSLRQPPPDLPIRVDLPSAHSKEFLKDAHYAIKKLLALVKFNVDNYQTCYQCGSFFPVTDWCIVCQYKDHKEEKDN
jgi:hypothetical protein